jgi:sugar phosphate isomerase/epimerase
MDEKDSETGLVFSGAGWHNASMNSSATLPFTYCLNTSTIAGHKLPLVEMIDLTAKAGFKAIEPWIREIVSYQQQGGLLTDLRKRIEDHGLVVANAIGFARWIVDDENVRRAALAEAKHDIDLVAQLGGKFIAAPPMGHHEKPGLDLPAAAARYAELFDLAASFGVIPLVEIWGPSKSLHRLGEALFIAAESQRPARLLLDVFHLYKGGSNHAGLRLLNGRQLPVFHVNDYPANPPRDKITDADRVYPGDGVAPLHEIFGILPEIGAAPFLSLELFNARYYQQDVMTVLTTGLRKLREVVEN